MHLRHAALLLALATAAHAAKPAPRPVALDASTQRAPVATVLQAIPELKGMLSPGDTAIDPSPGSYVALSDWPAGRTRALRAKLTKAGATGEASATTGERVALASGEGAERVSLDLTLERKKKDVVLAKGVLTTSAGTAPAPHDIEAPLSLVIVAWLPGGQAAILTVAPAETPAP